MFARVTQLEIDVMRTSVAEAVERFDAEVLPAAASPAGVPRRRRPRQPGGLRHHHHALGARGARRPPTRRYEAVLARYVTLFRSPPGREVYEVVLAELPRAAEGAPA